MPLTPSEKVRNARRRKRNGRAVLNVEVDLGEVADLLVDGGYLAAWDAEDRTMIAAALQIAIEVWARQ